MSVSGAGLDGASQGCGTPEVVASTPDYLNLSRMRQRHGWIIGTLRVWSNRARDRHQLQRLSLQAPDSVFEDVGMSRGEAGREARRWFWQEFVVLRRS